MINQQIIWTAVPAGGAGGTWEVVACPTIRLFSTPSPTTLASFADFVDWPAKLVSATTRFSVQFDGAAPIPAQLIGTPDSVAWKKVFPRSTPVRSFEVDDWHRKKVITNAAAVLEPAIRAIYGAVAKDGRPREDWLRVFGPFSDLGGPLPEPRFSLTPDERSRRQTIARSRADLAAQRARLRDALLAELAAKRHVSLPKSGTGWEPASIQKALAAFDEFHSKAPSVELQENEKDFHELVSLIRGYQTSPRRLGLSVRLKVVAPSLPTNPRVRVLVDGIAASSSVWTLAQTAPRFAPRPTSAAIQDGLLKVANGYSPQTIDVDGAIAKINNAVNTELRAQESATPQNSPVFPSLRSAGISLVEAQRGAVLVESFDRSHALEAAFGAGTEIQVGAEDLVGGLVVDVFSHETNTWQSLCQRQVQLIAEQNAVWPNPTDEEGAVTAVFAEPPATSGDPQGTVRAGEALFRWDGWSLVAPRPGGRVTNDAAMPVSFATSGGHRLRFSCSATPRSLPKLRYGRTYRFRLRIMDIAGNVVPRSFPAAPIDGVDSAEVTYLRADPVGPPRILWPEWTKGTAPAVRRGETDVRIVVRTTQGDEASGEQSERVIAPPPVAQVTAEQLGVFDDAFRPGADRATRHEIYTAISMRDAGAPDAASTGPTADTTFAQALGKQFAPVPAGDLETRYLLDPMAVGVSLLDIPQPGQHTILPFRRAGHRFDRMVCRIRARAATASSVTPEPDKGLVSVDLARGEIRNVDVACGLEPRELERMWLWGALLPVSLRTPAAAQHACAGRNIGLTPSQHVQLVHAVRLARPAKLGVRLNEKAPESPEVAFDVDLQAERDVVGLVDITASWTDPFDDGVSAVTSPEPSGQRVPDALAFQVPRDDPGTAAGASPVRLDAAGRFRGVLRTSTLFPDARHRRVTFNTRSVSRFADCFPADMDLVRPGTPTAEVRIPNAQRPVPVTLLDAVPTFTWEGPGSEETRKPTTTSFRRARRGDSVRLGLARPWFLSGPGELLGVVVFPSGPWSDDPVLGKYASCWAADPVRTTVAPPALGTTIANAALTRSGVVLPELLLDGVRLAKLPVSGALATCDVFGFPVHFDLERNAWVCDIAMKANAYSPFVRFAVTRFQPESLPALRNAALAPDAFTRADCCCSSIVLTQPIQLIVNRTLEVSLQSTGFATITLSGPGYPAQTTSRVHAVRAYVQTTTAAAPTDFDWSALDDTARPAAEALQPNAGSSESNTAWTVKVPIRARGSVRQRIMLIEEEMIQGVGSELQRRPVFVDAFEV